MKSSDFPDLQAMRQGIEFVFPVTCRGRTWKLRPLASLEIIQSASETADALSKLPDSQQSQVTASLLNASHQLIKASSSDLGATDATLTQQLLERMTPDEINSIWKQYVRITDRVNPDLEEMPAERLLQLVEDLKKNSENDSRLTDLPISHLIAVCRHLLQVTAG